MSTEEFDQLTPRLLYALLERYEDVERRADLRAGLLASLLYNPNRRKGTRAMQAGDFFPAAKKRRKRPAVSARRTVKASRTAPDTARRGG